MKHVSRLLNLVFLGTVIAFTFWGCGETSIYGTWGYEDKGVLYEMRLYNELREDKYTLFRDGGRTSGGTFTVKDDILTLTRTFGNYDMDKSGIIKTYYKDQYIKDNDFLKKSMSSDGKQTLLEWAVDNYFPIYPYKFKLTYNTLTLIETTTYGTNSFDTTTIYKKKKVKN